jgi:hypothetical protein
LTNVPQLRHIISIYNHGTRLNNLDVVVNGQKFSFAALAGNEEKTIDVASAMHEGDSNSITVTASGKPGSSVTVLISQ